MLLLQITPKARAGVTDCAEQLQRRWREAGARCEIFAADESSPPSTLLNGLAAEPAVAILLHLSGYGYASRGLCRWLVRDLAALLAARPDITLVTYYHEIFANGPPWRSAWWTKPEQQRIAVDLGGLSQAVWTNTSAHRDWLRAHLDPATPISLAPVISNVGEPATPTPASARSHRAVLFGSFASRRRCLEAPSLARRLDALGIETLLEIGPGASVGPIGRPLQFLGALAASDVSEVLADTCFGLLHYEPKWLGKSGVFAAYAAHGCVPLLTARSRDQAGDLIPGRHFLSLDAASADPALLDRIGAEAHAWYQPHRSAEQAEDMRRMLVATRRTAFAGQRLEAIDQARGAGLEVELLIEQG